MASLGWVSPGAAIEVVTPIFSWKNWRPFLVITVCQFSGCNPYFSHENMTTFLLITVTFIDFTRVSPRTFLPLRPRLYAIFFVNLPTNFFPLGVTPWRVSPGAVRPPSDDTGNFICGAGIKEMLQQCRAVVKVASVKHIKWRTDSSSADDWKYAA